MKETSRSGEGGDLAAESSGSVETVSGSLDEDSESFEMIYGSDIGVESFYDLMEDGKSVVYAGTGHEGFLDRENVEVIDPWDEDSEGLPVPQDVNTDDAVYVVDGSMAEVMAEEDWLAERRYSDEEEALEAAYDIVDGWVDLIATRENIGGVVLANDIHYSVGDAPVRFDYGSRRDGGEDTVFATVLSRFASELEEEEGWEEEFSSYTDEDAVIYLSSS